MKGKRDRVVIATKFGYDVDEKNRTVGTYGISEEESDVAGDISGMIWKKA